MGVWKTKVYLFVYNDPYIVVSRFNFKRFIFNGSGTPLGFNGNENEMLFAECFPLPLEALTL